LPSPIAIANPDLAQAWLGPVAALLVGLALGAFLMSLLRARREQLLARERNARGRRGEDRAAQLLAAAGYEIVARQQRASYELRSGVKALRVGLSFDFVVEKDGKQCVAEVKTGALGPQLKHADTRRQLLEYQLASGGGEVLLVDPEREEISAVSFPLHAPAPAPREQAEEIADVALPARTNSAWPMFVCIAVGVLCLYVLSR
jgi:hypothetical protein